MSPIRQELIAYSQQQRSDNQILRRLLESNTWYAPAGFAMAALGRTKFDRVLLPSRQEELPAGRMVFFTDFEAAQEADLAYTFAGEIAGVDLIDVLDPAQVTRVNINYGLPTAQTFYVDAESFALLKHWSASIRLERQLSAAAYEGGGFPFSAMRRHPGFLVAVNKADNRWHTGQVKGLDGECAMAFTAPDCLEDYMGTLDAQKREATSVIESSGERLFAALSGSRLAGVMINVGITVPAVLFPQILGAGDVSTN